MNTNQIQSEKATEARSAQSDAGDQMPGCWECPKCGFGLTKSVLYTKSGTVGPNTDPFMERCPNDGQIMLPLTYKKAFQTLYKLCEQLLTEMTWLDQHCSFVADAEYNLGPFKIGELRKLAQAGIAADLETKMERLREA